MGEESEHRPRIRARSPFMARLAGIVPGWMRVECSCGWTGPTRSFVGGAAAVEQQREVYVDHRVHLATGGADWTSDAAIAALIERELRG